MEQRYNLKQAKIVSDIRIDQTRKTPNQIREDMFNLKHPNKPVSKAPDFNKRVANLNKFKRGI